MPTMEKEWPKLQRALPRWSGKSRKLGNFQLQELEVVVWGRFPVFPHLLIMDLFLPRSCGRNAAHHAGGVPVPGWGLRQQQRLTQGLGVLLGRCFGMDPKQNPWIAPPGWPHCRDSSQVCAFGASLKTSVIKLPWTALEGGKKGLINYPV